MSKLLFDIETDNLYEDVSKIHCIVIKDLETDEIRSYTDQPSDGRPTIKEAEEALVGADYVVGHNIINYDLPVLLKLHGIEIPIHKVIDTLVLSRLFHTELKRFDFIKRTNRGFPSKLCGSHSLEAWGHRLENYKGMKPESFEKFTEEMLKYCIQDVEVNAKLYHHLMKKKWPEECVRLEHEVAHIISLQEKAGVCFDVKKAGDLYASLLKDKTVIEQKLVRRFKGWFKPKGEFTPKVNNKKRGYSKGCTFSKIEWVPFNPGSRQHLVKALKDNYNWQPKKFTEKGNPTLDEQVLQELLSITTEADSMLQYLTISKRISQLATGKQAWLKVVGTDGIIHGGVNSNGAVTGRMSHFRPNISQVPAIYSPYGKECRELFKIRHHFHTFIGADADGLELRCLAEFLYPYDGGRYARAVLYGNKDEGTDAHSLTLKALGNLCDTRDRAKTFFYALIYGAGDWKLGAILSGKAWQKNVKIGREARRRVEKGITGLGKLKEDVIKKIKERKRKYKRMWVNGIDGRKVYVRTEHAALNTLLQSAGAILMKKALVILFNNLKAEDCLRHGEEYMFVINSHDEWQIEAFMEWAEFIGHSMVNAMTLSGEYFKFKVPITGEYKIGKTWAETH